jgi:hypothetical protein
MIFAGLLIVALLLFQVPAFGQVGSGSLGATVADKTGGVVPNATVVLKNEASNSLRESVTNGSGFFNFSAVPPGIYTVTVSAPGLQSWERRNIVFTQGAVLTLPTIVLQVQSTKQELMVVAESDLVVPVDSGQSSQTLNRNMVEDLSIVGRDAAELIKIMPGMAMVGGFGQGMWSSYTTASNTGPIGNFSANGTQPYGAMTMTSDGANLLDPGNQGTQTANINQNQVAEVSILTSAYGAEFAKGPVTFQAYGKSGGAQFHGGAYLYARDGTFNSNDAYNNSQGRQAPSDQFFYPGGDLGGPILIPGTGFNKNRDKLFFYTAYENMRQNPAGSLNSYFVPDAQMKAGDFSPAHIASLGSGFANARSTGAQPLGGNATSQDGIQFPGGMIPPSMIDPNSAIYMKLFPASNTTVATNSTGTNYQYFVGGAKNRWEYRLRGDYNISQNTKLYVSWNRQREATANPISIWWSIGGSLPYPTGQDATQRSDIWNASLVHVFGPTLTNEFVFSQAKFVNPIHLANPDAVNPDKLGFKMTGIFQNKFVPQIPNTFGWNNAAVGFATYPYGADWPAGGAASFGKMSNTPNISDNVTKVAGTHTIKAGFYWDYARNNQVAGGGLSSSTQGAADFENWGAHSTGNNLADMVMARPSGFAQQKDLPVADFKYYQYSFYVNDQWKASRRLTLTLGLRFEHMGNWVPASGPGLAVWDQSKYNNTSSAGSWTGITWNAIDKSIPMSGFPSKPIFIEPRFGFAYDIFGDGRTVLRGGAGLFRYQLAYNSVSGAAYSVPLNNLDLGATWGCCVGWNQFNQYSPSLPGAFGLGSGPGGILTKGDEATPNTWTYNITISERAPWHSVAEFQYSGNRSYDMMIRGPLSNINMVPLGAFFKADPLTGVINDPAASGFPSNDYRPMRNYTDVTNVAHGSYSRYNALIVTWQKQTGRATFTTNYTFSKVLGTRDNQTDNGAGNGNTLDPWSIAKNYGVLLFDRTHIFNAAYVINLPSPVKGNMFAGGVVNGWVISGITQAQSGSPTQLSSGNSVLNVQWPGNFTPSIILGTNAAGPSGGMLPKIICDPRNGLSSGQHFNPACFAPPAAGTNGDVIWPYIKNPMYFNSDLAIYKNFSFKEHHKIQFRFSMFNFLNHPLPTFGAGGNADVTLNFNGGNNVLSQKNLNALTTGTPLYKTGRRVVEFALKYNF